MGCASWRQGMVCVSKARYGVRLGGKVGCASWGMVGFASWGHNGVCISEAR